MANFDPMALLDMEKRTGVKDKDIEAFLKKTTDLQQAIADMASGKLAPEDVHVEGIKMPEEIEAERVAAEENKRRVLAKDAARAATKKVDERTRWWRGAEYLFPVDKHGKPAAQQYYPEDDEGDDGHAADGDGGDGDDGNNAEGQDARARLVSKYSMDYSRWDGWSKSPDDPVTAAEAAEKEAHEEKAKNEVFEKSNADFCDGVKADMKKRQRRDADKKETAVALRLRGNRLYKRKDFEGAVEKYMASLKSQAYELSTLTNVANCHLKLGAHDDAEEFASRAVRVSRGGSAKAFSRRAAARRAAGKLDGSIDDLKRALACDPESAEIANCLRDAELAAGDERRERTATAEAAVPSNSPFLNPVEGGGGSNGGARPEEKDDGAEAAARAQAEALAAALAAAGGDGTGGGDGPAMPTPYEMIDSLLQRVAAADAAAPDSAQAKAAGTSLEVLGAIASETPEARVHLRTGGGVAVLCARLCGGGGGGGGGGTGDETGDGTAGRRAAPPAQADDAAPGMGADGSFDISNAAADDAADLANMARAAVPRDAKDPDPAKTLGALAAAVAGERKSKALCLRAGAVDAAYAFLAGGNAEVASAACAFLGACADDGDDGENCEAAGGTLTLRDAIKAPRKLAALARAVAASAAQAAGAPSPDGASLAAAVLRDAALLSRGRAALAKMHDAHHASAKKAGKRSAFSFDAKASKKAADKAAATAEAQADKAAAEAGSACDVVAVLTGALGEDGCRGKAFRGLREAVAATLANVAVEAALRPAFAGPAAAAAVLEAASGSRFDSAPCRAFALAALVNACLEQSNAVRGACFEADGVALCAAALSGAASARAEVERSRAAALLSRLSSHPSAAAQIRDVRVVKALADALGAAGGDALDACQRREHAVRALAGAVRASDAAQLALLAASGAPAAVARLLPRPAADGTGRVTRDTVTLPPRGAKVSTNLAANAVKLMITMLAPADSPCAAPLLAAGAIERLVSLLANDKTPAVRKNVAICLARASKANPDLKARVTELRGMEIILELGKALL